MTCAVKTSTNSYIDMVIFIYFKIKIKHCFVDNNFSRSYTLWVKILSNLC